MKTPLLLILSLALGAFAAPALTQTSAPVRRTVHRAGDWYVVRTMPENGTPVCTGFYMGHAGVQLSKDSLIVKTPGELKSIGLRFGNEPERPARPPEKAEQQIGAVMLAGADFEKLRHAPTLGLDIATSQGRARHTLRLEGFDAVVKNIEEGCPMPPAVAKADRAAAQKRERILKARCSKAGVARMREKEVPEWRINAMCPQAGPPPAPAAAK